MENLGKVSIVMPMYNCAAYVAQSIESVQAQTYPYWELLIVDDLSTDDSVAIVEEYAKKDDRIRLLQNPKNSGAALSRNYALREATGRWIAFLDSDDLWLPEKLAKQVPFMANNGYHFSYTQYREMDDNGVHTGVMLTGPKKVTKAKLFAYDYIGCLTVMYEREFVGLIQIPDLKKRNDYAMWLKVVKHCPCYLLPELLAEYRVRSSGSVTNRKAGILAIIKYYYIMYRESEGMGPVRAFLQTGINLFFGALKKLFYRKKDIK
ncbi:MAG: glycosyltransferase family 2 protein [Oscillospiraceae bacterium]|nr:glycosyltransferase family 2 protein [Oscillospiraceae bacterium]